MPSVSMVANPLKSKPLILIVLLFWFGLAAVAHVSPSPSTALSLSVQLFDTSSTVANPPKESSVSS